MLPLSRQCAAIASAQRPQANPVSGSYRSISSRCATLRNGHVVAKCQSVLRRTIPTRKDHPVLGIEGRLAGNLVQEFLSTTRVLHFGKNNVFEIEDDVMSTP